MPPVLSGSITHMAPADRHQSRERRLRLHSPFIGFFGAFIPGGGHFKQYHLLLWSGSFGQAAALLREVAILLDAFHGAIEERGLGFREASRCSAYQSEVRPKSLRSLNT